MKVKLYALVTERNLSITEWLRIHPKGWEKPSEGTSRPWLSKKEACVHFVMEGRTETGNWHHPNESWEASVTKRGPGKHFTWRSLAQTQWECPAPQGTTVPSNQTVTTQLGTSCRLHPKHLQMTFPLPTTGSAAQCTDLHFRLDGHSQKSPGLHHMGLPCPGARKETAPNQIVG